MQHAITIGDLVWWGGWVIGILVVFGIIVAVLSVLGSAMRD